MKWYNKTLNQIYQELNIKEEGLSDIEVIEKRKQYGYNELKTKPKLTIIHMVLEQLKDVMIIILLIASIISFFLNEWAEAIVILLIVIVNMIISILQEKKANDAIESLKKMNAPTARVLRNNEEEIIPAKELVVGDIVFLEDGCIVPADIRLIEASNLKIDESSLTGESVSVEKDEVDTLKADIPLGDRKNMAYASTIVTYGTAKGIVVAIAMDTEVGKIAHMLSTTDELDTPLKRKLNKVGKMLSVVGILISIGIFIIGFLYGQPLVALFMTSISLAISVIPEGLPATATIVMALGVERMAKRNALVRKLPAVETLGSASIICTDKTGTLTQNKMTVVKYATYHDFNQKKAKSEKEWEQEKELLYACVLCNNAKLNSEEILGDPTEGALLSFAQKLGIEQKKLEQDYPRLFEQPFDSIRKRMSTIHEIEDKKVVYTKGAIDELLPLCSKMIVDGKEAHLTEELKDKIMELCLDMSKEALRVLAFAKKEIKEVPEDDDEDVEYRLTFIGVVGMIDPPRIEVMKAIETCHKAGIRVMMITGDHRITALTIAKQLGICEEGDDAISGEELEKMKEEELDKKIKHISVFARVSPNDKLRIVSSLKRNKETVAMTGDGVNDAPALKAADIGVAMGITGTDVAKDASDMILLDDNFTTIEYAIREGRRIYNNIQKVIQYLLAGNISEVLTIFVATLFNWPAPILAVHILLINLVTDTIPALALGIDPENSDIMEQKPVKNGSLFEQGLISRVIFHGILLTIITLTAYQIGVNRYNNAVGTTLAFATLALSQVFHSLNQHSNKTSILSKKHPKNIYLYIAMLLSISVLLIVMLVPPIASFFRLESLTLAEWLIVIALSIVPVIVVEIYKAIKKLSKKS